MLTKRIRRRAPRAVVTTAAVALLFVAAATGSVPRPIAVGLVVGIGAAVPVGLVALHWGWPVAAFVAGSVAVLAVVGVLAWPDRSFRSHAFREAAAAKNYDELYTQAQRAVAQEVLLGRTKHEVSALLGGPKSATRREWSWYVGVQNDFIGPGDDTWFRVSFDPRTGRVIGASV